jgi:hypothetical protein
MLLCRYVVHRHSYLYAPRAVAHDASHRSFSSVLSYANIPKVQTVPNPRRLHAVLLQVLAELDNRVVGVGSLDTVGVVGDDEGLCGLEDDDAFLALCVVLDFLQVMVVWRWTHLLCLD